MLKKDTRLFFAAFWMSLIIAGFTAALLYIDAGSSRGERGATDRVLTIASPAPLKYEMNILNGEIEISLMPLDLANAYRKQLPAIFTPRLLRHLEHAYYYGTYAWDTFSNWYNEKAYQREVTQAKGS